MTTPIIHPQEIPENAVVAYTDGACKGNPGTGGWGAFICHPNGAHEELYGGETMTTNNRMELMAAIEAIKHISSAHFLILYTDSSYVQKGMSEWLVGWKRKGWIKSDGKPVLNADLWKILDTLCAKRQIEWRWVKGHAGNMGNEKADSLANQGALLSSNNP